MRRLFWLGVGVAAGAYGMRRLTRAAQAYTPAGITDSLSRFGDGLREMAEVVREGMAEREGELRVALGIDTGIDSGLPGNAGADDARRLIEDPTGPAHRAR